MPSVPTCTSEREPMAGCHCSRMVAVTRPEMLKLASALPSPLGVWSDWHIPDFPFF